MIVRRLALALRRQDWGAVFVEFVLVLAGVLAALQANNFNDARLAKKGVIKNLERVRGEVEINIATLDEQIDAIEAGRPARNAAIDALLKCDPSPNAQASIENAVAALTGDIVPALVENSIRELTRRDTYLDLLSDEFRAMLNKYDGRLGDERHQLRTNFNLLWDQHVLNHPFVDMVETTNPDAMVSLQFGASEPMATLCETPSFRRRFFMADVWHQSFVLRMTRFNEWSEEFLVDLDRELARLN